MNTIKKTFSIGIIFSIFWTLGLWLVTAWESLDNYVKNNIDYISTSSLPLRLRKPYPSKNKKIYLVFGTTMALSPQNYNDASLIKYISQSPSNFLGVFQGDNLVYIIDLSKSKYSKTCLPVSDKKNKLISSLYNIKKYPKAITVLLGDPTSIQVPECYQNENFYIVPKTTLAATDAYQTYKYSQQISDNILNHPLSNQDSLLKNLYNLVLEFTSYDYETLKKYGNGTSPTDMTPWLGSSVFLKNKVVCDGYVKAFYRLIKYFGLGNPIREVGKLQTPDAQNLGQRELLHSRIKLNGRYFDPTFDDMQDKNSSLYFNLPRSCFVINHYKQWREKLDTTSQRLAYITNHYWELLNECPQIVIKTTANDGTLTQIIQHHLNQGYSPSLISPILCKEFNICLQTSEPQKFVETLKKYTLTISSWKKQHKISFKSLSLPSSTNVSHPLGPSQAQQNTSQYQLSLKQKLQINMILSDYFKKLPASEKDITKKRLKNILESYNLKNLSPQKRAIIDYILEILPSL